MQEHLQILEEQYRTNWHRQKMLSEYDVKAQECIGLATKPSYVWYDVEDNHKWVLEQAKIFRDRAIHICPEWDKQEVAKEAAPQ